jgi:hypothetical protein
MEIGFIFDAMREEYIKELLRGGKREEIMQ